jgi:hypothetical protein
MVRLWIWAALLMGCSSETLYVRVATPARVRVDQVVAGATRPIIPVGLGPVEHVVQPDRETAVIVARDDAGALSLRCSACARPHAVTLVDADGWLTPHIYPQLRSTGDAVIAEHEFCTAVRCRWNTIKTQLVLPKEDLLYIQHHTEGDRLFGGFLTGAGLVTMGIGVAALTLPDVLLGHGPNAPRASEAGRLVFGVPFTLVGSAMVSGGLYNLFRSPRDVVEYRR